LLKEPSTFRRYLPALLAPAIVTAVIQLTWPFFELSATSPFLAAVMFCAWYGGLGPGLLSAALSIAIADYLFVKPYLEFWAPSQGDTVKLVTLAAVGVFISVLSEGMHAAKRRAENSLDISKVGEERYRSLVKTTADLVWNTDRHNQILHDTSTWSLVTGQSSQQLKERGWIKALHPDDQIALQDAQAKARADSHQYELDVRIRRSNGSYGYYTVRGVPTLDEKGANAREWLMVASEIREHKRANEQFSQVIEGAPNGMLLVDAQGRIVLVNAEIERMFGYDRGELLGQSVDMLVPDRFRDRHPHYREDFIANAAARAMGAGRDLFGLRSDGSEFPVEIGLNPIKADEGLMVLSTVVDITERKLAEAELRSSKEQLAGVISSAMDAIITVAENQTIVLFNNAAEKMFLYPAEDAIGQRLDRFIPERFRPSHQEHIQNFGSTHVTKRSMGALGALFGLRADGEEFPIEASISQLETSGKKLYTVILRDITERKRAEETLNEQAKILDMAPVVIHDLNSRIVFWNKGAEQMYGWTAAEVTDKSSHVVLQTVFPKTLEEIKARVFARGHWEGELTHTRRDGQRIVVLSHWVLHRDENGKPKAILEVNNDITERRKAEEEVRRLNEELEVRVEERTAELQAANKELEAFSYSVSHDLRAPLRHINGFSQALLEDYEESLDNTARGYLNEVREASQEMAQLIDDLLQLARVARTEIHRVPVNLSETARDIVMKLRAADEKREARVEIEDGLVANGDKRLLGIVLTNLLQNAWKFTSQRDLTEISFRIVKKNGEKVFSVSDNGAGFDMSFGDKLFGAFQRLHGADEFEGTGVGLATVQRIINRHGGRVWAEGHVGKGATFFFALPVRKENSDE
jgi:PAS domain S-box-containing protein